MSTNLDDMLSDDPAAPAAAQSAPPAPEPIAAEQTGDREPEAAPPAASLEQHADPEFVPRKAVIEERRKRQDLERKLAELEAQRAPARPPEPQAEAPDWYANPEQAAAVMRFEMQNQIYQTKVYQSEKAMKAEHQDYDEVSTIFAEVAKADPNLARQVFEHPFPAEFAYQAGKQIQLMCDIGNDPGAYRARLKAELMAELGQSPEPAAPQAQPRSAAVPRSLARDVSQQPRRTNGQFDAPASLDEILG